MTAISNDQAKIHIEAMLGELLRHDADENHPRILAMQKAIAALAPPSGEGVDSYWIHASAWNEIVLDQPLGDDQYSKGYSEALNAITRNLCALPKPAATPQSASEDGEQSFIDEWESRFGFLATHNNPRSIESIDEVACLLITPPPASQERGGEVDRMAWRLLRHPDLRAVLEYAVENSDDMQAMGCLRRLDRILAASPPSSAPPSYCPHCGQRDDGVLACCERFMEPPSSAAEGVTAGGTSTSDDEFPGMWSPSDLTGGATDAAEQAKPDGDDK